METPKTFKELFSGTGIEPTTDESGNTHYNFKATMKEEPKQTAVEWLAEQMLWNEFHNPYLDQAKEMEKQQIIDACKKFGNLNGVDIEDYKQYYNKRFN